METLEVSAKEAAAVLFVPQIVLSGGDKCNLEKSNYIVKRISFWKSLLRREGGLQSV